MEMGRKRSIESRTFHLPPALAWDPVRGGAQVRSGGDEIERVVIVFVERDRVFPRTKACSEAFSAVRAKQQMMSAQAVSQDLRSWRRHRTWR